MVSHGDFICHPRPCERYNHGTVVEFYCDPGYSLTSDYKYITCQYGEWFPSYQVYCIKSGMATTPGQSEQPRPAAYHPSSHRICRHGIGMLALGGRLGMKSLPIPSLGC